MIHFVRALFLLVVLAFTVSYSLQQEVLSQGPLYATLYILTPALAAFGLIMLDMFWRNKHLQALSGLFFGLLAGLVIAYVLAQIVTLVANVFVTRPAISAAEESPVRIVVASPAAADPNLPPSRIGPGEVGGESSARIQAAEPTHPVLGLVKVLLGSAAVFMCVSFILQTKDDFRFVIPYVEFSKQTKGARPILLDTSVIIDGRIADMAETRIFESEVIVPRFILHELQAIADSEDKLRRNRGRRGLDVLNRLQDSKAIEIRITDPHVRAVEQSADVDAKLVALAQHVDARVVTNDYNLNKVAQLRGVDVININDLANALKPVVLPGEAMQVKIVKPGEEAGQGVGYLEDGTMVVIEQGREAIGKQVELTVTSVFQTSAGRMIFGRLEKVHGGGNDPGGDQPPGGGTSTEREDNPSGRSGRQNGRRSPRRSDRRR